MIPFQKDRLDTFFPFPKGKTKVTSLCPGSSCPPPRLVATLGQGIRKFPSQGAGISQNGIVLGEVSYHMYVRALGRQGECTLAILSFLGRKGKEGEGHHSS